MVEVDHVLSSVDLKLKEEDITKWIDCKEIKALSNLTNTTKKKNLSNMKNLSPNDGGKIIK